MKITDYAPRTAPFDHHLIEKSIKELKPMKGVEVGVDVGAHAESLLTHCSRIEFITLVDIWDKEYYRGYCQGRLEANGFKDRFKMIPMSSEKACNYFDNEELDFLYFDQKHDFDSVSSDLKNWWRTLKTGGILGYRNYADKNIELVKAVNLFIQTTPITHHMIETGEIIIIK